MMGQMEFSHAASCRDLVRCNNQLPFSKLTLFAQNSRSLMHKDHKDSQQYPSSATNDLAQRFHCSFLEKHINSVDKSANIVQLVDPRSMPATDQWRYRLSAWPSKGQHFFDSELSTSEMRSKDHLQKPAQPRWNFCKNHDFCFSHNSPLFERPENFEK
jgi:hypothetical protein